MTFRVELIETHSILSLVDSIEHTYTEVGLFIYSI